MQKAIAILICLMILATPCLYDQTSGEPSPLEAAASLLAPVAR